MMERISEFNKKFGFKNFSLRLRLSNVNDKYNKYWTKDYVLEELENILEEHGESVMERQSSRMHQDTS